MCEHAPGLTFPGPPTNTAGDAKLDDMMSSLNNACRQFLSETGIKPVFIVEDPHTCHVAAGDATLNENARMLAATLVSMYNAGWINVVYTISDNNGETMLRKGT